MSDSFLPDIDIRIGALRPHNIRSIHSLGREVNRKKNRQIKYQMIKQSLLTPTATPLHKLVRVSLSNKTVVFKKKMLTEERDNSENRSPFSCHQTNKIVILNQSPDLKSQYRPQRNPGLKGCKSLLNTKNRDRRLSFEMHRKRCSLKPEEDSTNSDLLPTSNQRLATQQGNRAEDFILCPWQNENRNNRYKLSKNDQYLEPIKRCL